MILQLILIQLGTFAVLIVVLRVLFYRQLSASLVRLKQLQEETLARENQLKDEVERTKAERAAELEQGRKQVRAIIDAAKKDAENILQRSEAQARDEREHIVRHAQEEREHLAQKLTDEIDAKVADFAVGVVQALFSDAGRAAVRDQFTAEVIDDIDKLDTNLFTVRARVVEVVSPKALSAAQKERLQRIVSRHMGPAVGIQETIEEALIAGVIVRIGEFIIDGSLRNKLQRSVAAIKAQQGSA